MSDCLGTCGCGRPGRYAIGGRGACNKHGRCPTYEDLEATLKLQQKKIAEYKEAFTHYRKFIEYTNSVVI